MNYYKEDDDKPFILNKNVYVYIHTYTHIQHIHTYMRVPLLMKKNYTHTIHAYSIIQFEKYNV